MSDPPKSRLSRLAPPGMKPVVNANPEPTEPPLPRSHTAEDLPKPPRWRRVLSGLGRVAAIAAPGAASAGAAQVQLAAQQGTAAESLRQRAVVDQLMVVVVVQVPSENTQAKQEETKAILREAWQFMRGLPGEILADAVKDAAKLALAAAPIAALAGYLRRQSVKNGNQSLAWLADLAEKIAGLFGAEPKKDLITSEQLDLSFGDKAVAAKALLLIAGYQEKDGHWQRSS